MQFQQRQFTRTTLLALREHGLYLGQGDGRGRMSLEVEMPYEEVLPLRIERRNTRPERQLPGVLFLLIWAASSASRSLSQGEAASDEFWLWAIGLGLGLLAVVLYGVRNWWYQLVLHTGRGQVVLADRRSDRRALLDFAETLEARTKSYLRREYAAVNPLGFIEPQLRRVAWLRELNVLSGPEATALSTRLTGRLTATPLRSMGQELEAPYVN
ncbi:hypothetical protein GCM10023185_31440 [Hymenobacter saemangeumensis]|uniref:DUF304 domain-containing protein n=1 Tax=Hymenobacter saemangeumensis TaxID=1084522 RepID=A0ABP8IMR0_9BACT